MSHVTPEGADNPPTTSASATSAPSTSASTDHATTGELITRLSQETSRLVRDEMRLAQAELTQSGKKAGMGIGLFGAGGVLAWFGFGTLIAAVVLALALAVPYWLAALIVAVVLFAVAGIAALMGKKQVQQASPKPERTVETVKADIDTVKEARNRDHTS